MIALYVLRLALLLIGALVLASTFLRWRDLSSNARAGRCASASALMALSTLIGATA